MGLVPGLQKAWIAYSGCQPVLFVVVTVQPCRAYIGVEFSLEGSGFGF